jgi:exodeoxyribonuclease V alpha subunit
VSSPSAEPDAIVLEGIVERITYADETTGFHVVRVRPDGPSGGAAAAASASTMSDLARARLVGPDGVVTVVGKMPKVGRGEHVRVVGAREQDARHGPQLKATVVTTSPPTSPAGIRRYLASGAIKGVGAKTADRIVDCFGERTLEILDHAPERLSEVGGLGKAKASQIAAQWRSQRAVRELMLVLASLDIPQALAVRIRARYGDDAIDVVRRTPYRLALEVAGVGFKSADAIARKGGIALDDPERAQAGVLHGVSTMTDDGHTATPRALLAERACALLAPPTAKPDALDAAPETELDEPAPAIDFAPVVDAAIDALVASKLLVDTPEGLAHAPLAAEEATLARRLLTLVRAKGRPPLGGAQEAIESFEAAVSMQLAPAQRDAVRLVAEHPVVVVTGGPGVGKTTVVRAILALLGRSLRVALTAPTGRAAKRMTEATGREATTIHRLLAIDPRTRRFKHDEATPLEIDALVVDESSMVDVFLAHALVRALPQRARLVLVGDVDQLPSVGPGAFLRDVIDSGVVPTARLRDVFRQAASSRIIAGAHAILHGRMPEPSERAARSSGGKAAGELFIIERKDPEEAARTIVEVVEQRLPRAFGFDPKREIQVLVPMIRGVVGTRALNVELQARLNPTGPSFQRSGTLYRIGDRVMQTRNDYDRDVFNGDVGSVAAVRGEDGEGPSVEVRLEDGRMVAYEDEDLDDLVLAYACTVHKAQGSEYPAVVIGLVNQHYLLLARKLLYTAVTRGKQLVVIVASPWALREAVRDARGEERRTTLARLLRG